MSIHIEPGDAFFIVPEFYKPCAGCGEQIYIPVGFPILGNNDLAFFQFLFRKPAAIRSRQGNSILSDLFCRYGIIVRQNRQQ